MAFNRFNHMQKKSDLEISLIYAKILNQIDLLILVK